MVIAYIIGGGINFAAFCLFPISIAMLYTINNLPASTAAKLANTYTTYSVLLGISTFIVAAELITWIYLSSQDPGFLYPGFRMVLCLAAFMGIVGCGFLLDHLNQALAGPLASNFCARVIASNEMQLQALAESQPILIAGLVICSAIILGSIAEAVYKFTHI